MTTSSNYKLQEQIDRWIDTIQSEPSFTESDCEELKSHLLDLIDRLKGKGLDDEEAFMVAIKRMGYIKDWGDEYRITNNPVTQMRRSLIILAGVLVYFFLFYFIEFSSKLFLFELLIMDIEEHNAVTLVPRYLIICFLGVMLFFLSIYFFEKKTITFIEKIKIKPKITVIFLIITFLMAIADTCLYVIIKELIGDYFTLRSNLHHYYIYFEYSFPLMLCLIFILIYFKYYKTAKI